MGLHSPWNSPGQKCLGTNSTALGRVSTNPIPEPRGLKPPVLWRPLATHRCEVRSAPFLLPRSSARPVTGLEHLPSRYRSSSPSKGKQVSCGGLGSLGEGSAFGQYFLTLRKWVSGMSLKNCIFLPVFPRRNRPECAVLAGPSLRAASGQHGPGKGPGPRLTAAPWLVRQGASGPLGLGLFEGPWRVGSPWRLRRGERGLGSRPASAVWPGVISWPLGAWLSNHRGGGPEPEGRVSLPPKSLFSHAPQAKHRCHASRADVRQAGTQSRTPAPALPEAPLSLFGDSDSEPVPASREVWTALVWPAPQNPVSRSFPQGTRAPARCFSCKVPALQIAPWLLGLGDVNIELKHETSNLMHWRCEEKLGLSLWGYLIIFKFPQYSISSIWLLDIIPQISLWNYFDAQDICADGESTGLEMTHISTNRDWFNKLGQVHKFKYTAV